MEYNLMEQYWLWLSAVPGMSPRRFYALLNACGDARALWDDPVVRPGRCGREILRKPSGRAQRALLL